MNTRTWQALSVAAALFTLGLAACTDTTVEPKSTITDANIFNDPNSYRAFLAKIYGGLALSGQQGPAGQADIQGIDEGFSQYLRLYWETEELPTDEAVIAWNDIGLPEMNTQLWTSQSNMVVAMYYRIYFQVALANEFLRQTTDAKLASRGVGATLKADIQTYRAEARFLRALSLWHAIDLFGDVPLVTEADPVGSTPPKQATRADVYNFIVTELNDIKGSLPAAGANTYGRATPGAADMLLAELYLNAAVYTGTPNYAGALAAATSVIGSGAYSLDPNYHDMFLADNGTSPEIIFAITQDGLKTQTWGGVTFLVHASCGGSMSNSTYGIDGCWWGLRLKPEAYNRFSAGDSRASYFYTTGQTLTFSSVDDRSNFTVGAAAPKFQNVTSGGAAGSNATFVDADFPVFRLAEAYLIYAEAWRRGGGGDSATAYGYFNQIRERAFGNTSADIAPGALTLNLILDERGRELLWEAHRRTDLVRYGLFTGATYVWTLKGNTVAGTSTDAFRDLYPLPASELIANPNLKQNPGY
ncbi:MAG TPA: RagB/SusD family nutrient uptake outer membrane protein [Gemmatimonadales bacterium]|nr:RagB/SusD family nutrient uptake outer membrane protein [Gemmatimonadales bacterium]